jgi:hypothetical protein
MITRQAYQARLSLPQNLYALIGLGPIANNIAQAPGFVNRAGIGQDRLQRHAIAMNI